MPMIDFIIYISRPRSCITLSTRYFGVVWANSYHAWWKWSISQGAPLWTHSWYDFTICRHMCANVAKSGVRTDTYNEWCWSEVLQSMPEVQGYVGCCPYCILVSSEVTVAEHVQDRFALQRVALCLWWECRIGLMRCWKLLTLLRKPNEELKNDLDKHCRL